MRLLYLHYGPQSGVTAALAASLAGAGVNVQHANPAEGFSYQLRPGLKLPNPRPAALRGLAEAMRAHGKDWKAYYLHTHYSFDHLSALAADAIRRVRPDVVLQAGVLFGPGPRPDAPFHLYLDHTWAIAERYQPAPGLPPPPPFDGGWRQREEAVYRTADAIFTMSEAVRTSLRDDYGIDPARVHVVGAGPNVWPEEGDLAGPRDPEILFVGKSFVAKGGPALLEAFASVRREHPDARLHLVCSSAPARLPPGATWHGLLGRAPLGRLFSRCSVFALPTLREAFGLVVLEAMGFGLPVVASGIEAIPEMVVDGETGLLVPPQDPAALARALGALLADPARARRMGEAGRARAHARFGWDRAAARMLAVMKPSAWATQLGAAHAS